MNKFLVLVVIAGFANAGTIHQQEVGPAPEYGVPAQAVAVQNVQYGVPAVAANVPADVSPIVKETPQQNYGKSIPAAAIRNLEKVEVTKTITPVVTKTTTHQSHSEPALSVGHVQGYTQTTVGEPKFAEVQYNTVYTQYLNPTVGQNGPVTYSGPAVSEGVAHHQGVAYSPVAVQAQYAVAAAPVAKAIHAAPAPVQYAYAQAAPVAKAFHGAPAQFAYAGPAPIAAAPAPSFLGSLYSVAPAYGAFGVAAPVAKAYAAPVAAAPVVKTAAYAAAPVNYAAVGPAPVNYAAAAPAPVNYAAAHGPVEGAAYAAGPAAIPGAITDATALLASAGYQGFFV